MAAIIAVCPRCNGTGRYDRGACYGCRPFGSMGWVRKSNDTYKSFAQVTAIRDTQEGRIDWIKIHGASAKRAVEIVQRQMRVAGLPDAIINSVEANVVVK